MLDTWAKSAALRFAVGLLLLVGLRAGFGCAENDAGSGSGGSTEEEQSSQGIAGTYTGTVTAKTDTVGVVEGLPLNASAIANSSMLEFTLEDVTGVTSDGLAPQTAEESIYSGTGRIVMAAAGSGTVGPAGGGFSNTSGDPVEVLVQGSAVTFKVTISGHTYAFDGTIQGM